MSKKTKATKHITRLRSHKKKRPKRINPLVLPVGFIPKALDDQLIDMMFDQALLSVLRTSGIRDALFEIIKKAPPKKDEEEGPKTIQ